MRPPMTVRDLASRKNSVGLGATAVAAAALAGFLFYYAEPLMRIWNGPEPATLSKIMDMGPEAAGRWFDVTSDARGQHLLQTTSKGRRSGTTITNHFAVIRNKALVVQAGSSTQLPPRFLAWSSEFRPESSYFERAKSQLGTWGVRQPISPLLLTTSAGVDATRNLHAAGLALAKLLLLYLFYRFGRAMADYTRTPQIAALKKSVRAPEGIPKLIAEVDQQLATRDPAARRTGPIMLPAWFLDVRQNSFSLMSADDVIWVAPYVLTNSKWGGLKKTSQAQVHLVSRASPKVILTYKDHDQAALQETLTHFYRWAPWAVVGNDDTMEQRFGKKKFWQRFKKMTPKDEILKLVDDRRRQIYAAWAQNAAQQAAQAQAPGHQQAAPPPPHPNGPQSSGGSQGQA